MGFADLCMFLNRCVSEVMAYLCGDLLLRVFGLCCRAGVLAAVARAYDGRSTVYTATVEQIVWRSSYADYYSKTIFVLLCYRITKWPFLSCKILESKERII